MASKESIEIKKQPLSEEDRTEFIRFLENHVNKLTKLGITDSHLTKILENLKGETL